MSESVPAKLWAGKAVGEKDVEMAEVELWTRGTKRKAFEQERSNTAKMYRQIVVQVDTGVLPRRGEDGSTASTVEMEFAGMQTTTAMGRERRRCRHCLQLSVQPGELSGENMYGV